MRKFITVSMFALSLTSAALAAPILNGGKEVLSKHPLGVEYRSKEYGGTKDAIDAYSDGVGVFVGGSNPNKIVNQAPMNELVAKYGDSAKAKGITVAEEVTYGGTATEADKALLAKAIDVNSIIPDGTACDDGNVQTIKDKYTSGTCAGINPPVPVTYEPFTGLYYTEEQSNMQYAGAVSYCQKIGMRLPHLSETVANKENTKKGIPSALPLRAKYFWTQTAVPSDSERRVTIILNSTGEFKDYTNSVSSRCVTQ